MRFFRNKMRWSAFFGGCFRSWPRKWRALKRLRGGPKSARLYDRRVFRARGLGGVFCRNSLGGKRIGSNNAPDGRPPFSVNHFCRPFSKREKGGFSAWRRRVVFARFQQFPCHPPAPAPKRNCLPHSQTLRAQRTRPMCRQVLDPVPACLSEPVHKFTHTLSKPMPAFLQLSGGVRLRRSARGGLIPRRIFGRGRLACPGNRRSGRNPGW